jgi:hypothetical protein
VFVPSMKELDWDSEPKSLSPGCVWSGRRDLERVWSCLLMSERKMRSAKLAKKGLRGQPRAEPLACSKLAKVPSGLWH